MEIKQISKSIEVSFPSGRIFRVTLYLQTNNVDWDIKGTTGDYSTAEDISVYGKELIELAELINKEFGVDTSDKFIIVNPPFKSEEDKLREVYFSFYNQMDEPERGAAKINFDMADCHADMPPEKITDALASGFPWGKGESFDYWKGIADKYRQEEPKSEEDKLKDVFFSFYDKMDEPERSQAKENWNYKYAINRAIATSITLAISRGFSWSSTTQGFGYWDMIDDKYAKK